MPRWARRGRADLRAGIRLRPDAGRVVARGRRPACGGRDWCGSGDAAGVGSPARGRRQPRACAARPRDGRQGVLRAVVGRGVRRPAGPRRRSAENRRDGPFLAELAERGAHSRPPVARPHPALGARDQGADVHADGRDGRRCDHVAARDARRRAQLGLPLHLDARHHVHTAGPPLAQPRLGSGRVHAVRRGPRAEQRRLAADHVRHRRSQGPDRIDTRRSLGLRRGSPRPARKRRVRPAPERRLRRGARLDPAAHEEERAATTPSLADRAVAGRVRDQGLGASRIRASGRRAASRSTTSPRS